MRDLYTRAAATAAPLVRGVADHQLDGPTPCAEFSVRDLTNHLFQVIVEFQKAARFEQMDFVTPPDYLTGDWRQRFATELDNLTDAWSRPDARDGDNSQMGFPREIVARMPVFDLTIHGWDLARATGQPYSADAGLLDDVYAMAQQIAERARDAGQFGRPVAMPDDAPTADKLVGLVGRDPSWKP